jgi:polysaccharide export outer membrane protein
MTELLVGTAIVAVCWLPAVVRHWRRPAALQAAPAVDRDFSAQVVPAGWRESGAQTEQPGNVPDPELPHLAFREDTAAGEPLGEKQASSEPPQAPPEQAQSNEKPADGGPPVPADGKQPLEAGGQGEKNETAAEVAISAVPPDPPGEPTPAPAVPPARGYSPAASAVAAAAPRGYAPAASAVAAAAPRGSGSMRSMVATASAPGQFLASTAVPIRSAQLEDIARQADRQTVYGYELANRGAYFAARAEFIAALGLVAEGLDNEEHTGRHSQALGAALTALKEVKDLLPAGAKLEAETDLAAIVAGHRTPVLHDAPAEALRPMAAVKSYFAFAQEQLAAAAGREVAGSMTLAALGKLHAAMARQNYAQIPAAESKAIVFFQAALLVFPQNYIAANEMGVLLAHAGNPAEARRILEHSVGVYPGSVNLANLAAVYQQLGQPQWATALRRQAEVARRMEESRLRGITGSAGGTVQWVPPAALAQSGVQAADPPRFRQPATSAPAAGPSIPSVRPAAAPAVPPAAAPAGLTEDAPAACHFASGDPPDAIRGLGPCLPSSVLHPSSFILPSARSPEIVLCQALGPAAPCPIYGVDCSECQGRCRGWEQARAIAWQAYAQGEYVGHARSAHVAEYRIRVDDGLEMMYRLTRDRQPNPYQLNVGDVVTVESFSDPAISASVSILPDGTITLRLLGPVQAAGHTVAQLRDRLEELYKKYYKVPAITITPTKFDTRLEDLRAVVDRRAGIAGGQAVDLRVTPEGTVALPAIGSVQAQGLTLPELQKEVNERYRQTIEGIEVMPILTQRAPRYVYVLGEVHNPGRFEMVGPTTILQAVSLAGSWNVGANLCQVVVFRRGDDWRLLASMVNLEGALRGKQACPPGEIWLSDSDVVIVPKSRILELDDIINLTFTRGIYGVFPLYSTITFQKLSTI